MPAILPGSRGEIEPDGFQSAGCSLVYVKKRRTRGQGEAEGRTEDRSWKERGEIRDIPWHVLTRRRLGLSQHELQLMQDLPAWFPLSGRAPFGEREFVPVGSTLRLSALPERLFTRSIG